MSERVILWEQLEREWEQPLSEDVTSLCCGTFTEAGRESSRDQPEIIWNSEIEPRVFNGLPFSAAILGSPPASLVACRFPRPEKPETVADCLRFWGPQSNWGGRVISSTPKFPPLVPSRSLPFTRWRSRLLAYWGVSEVDPSRPELTALAAGARQLCDDLDGSHEHSQSIEGMGVHRDGDYWHAIMHRREPDYGNSCYWFRRVGRHPLFPSLAQEWLDLVRGRTCFPELTSVASDGIWDPTKFVRACEATVDPDERQLLEAMQYREFLLLFRWTYLSVFPQ